MKLLEKLLKRILGNKVSHIKQRMWPWKLLDSTGIRTSLATRYLKGNGIEIGALHRRLIVPYCAKVKYIDRLSVQDLRIHYPELNDSLLINVDIIDDGEHLEKIAPDSQDFVIANHFLEHSQNPIGAIETFLRVLKKGGILYLAVPDKRFMFDKDRPVTTLEHLIRDYKEGTDWSRRQHFYEWSSFCDKKSGLELETHTQTLMDKNYSIHFHVWTDKELSEFFVHLKQKMNMGFEILESIFNYDENIFIIKKV